MIGVEDNGPGVAPEIAERLFEPFETTKPRGMGLGLPLAKEIATRHGGALTLATALAARNALRTGAAARMNAAPPVKRRVFIVDDEPEIRDALSLALSTSAWKPRNTPRPRGSGRMRRTTSPIACCSTIACRGVSGVELLPRIVERSKQAAVIMMTGHGDIPTAVQAMKLGAYHFVEKPFDRRKPARRRRGGAEPRRAEVGALCRKGARFANGAPR